MSDPSNTDPPPGRDGEPPASDPLGPYFRDIAGYSVMSREAELAAAVAIVQQRRGFWRCALAYPPFIDGICDLVPQILPALAPELPAAMKRAARNLRDRELLAHQRAYAAAREQLALLLAEADQDGLLADRLIADLIGIGAGALEGLSMRVKLPPRGSLPFLGYVQAVRAEHDALNATKAAFVTANLRLVVSIARRFGTPRLPLPDLIQDGNLGLLKAVERFDPARGFRFSTYASSWIRHAIGRAIADKGRAVRLPVHMQDAHHRVRKARREFETLHGRAPTDDELAGLTGVSVERQERMRWALLEEPLSLDAPLAGDDSLRLIDALVDGDAPVLADAIDHDRLLDQLHEALGTLPALEADILRKRVGLDGDAPLTLQEVGELHSLSRERIRQLQELGLARLRGEFKRRALL